MCWRAAARADDDTALAACLFEALHFNPINPVIYRRAARQCVIAANLSAMFDPLSIPAPNTFRTDRPWVDYMLWGYGMHTCFGAHINRAVIPALLKPLFQRPNLRRAKGAQGQIDTGGTPFPQHLHLTFEPA